MQWSLMLHYHVCNAYSLMGDFHVSTGILAQNYSSFLISTLVVPWH